MARNAKQELINFVVRRALDPVMKAKPDGRPEAERRRLEHVQDATRSEIERYRGYGSAQEVVVNFRRDLNSHAAQEVHADLKALHLPTINDIEDEFDAKVEDLGVQVSS